MGKTKIKNSAILYLPQKNRMYNSKAMSRFDLL